jgi:hypothetical protein
VLFSAAGFLWLDQHGVALSRDSAHYLRVAADLRFNGFFLPAEPAYPLGYPLLVAQVMRWEPFAADAARTLSWLSYGAALLSMAALGRRVAGPVVASLAVAVLATLPPVVGFHGYALSDPIFGALILVHTWLAVCAFDVSGRARYGWLAAAALVLGVATLVRVIGYAPIVVFTGAVLVLGWRDRARPGGWLRLALAHAPCYLPAAGVALAYSVVGRPVHGYRGGSSEPLALNVERAASALIGDLGPWLLLPACLGIVWWCWRVRGRALGPTPLWTVGYTLSLCVVYLVAVIVAATLTKVSPVGSRFLMAYYGLFLLIVLAGAGLAPAGLRRGASVVVAFALLRVLAANAEVLADTHQVLVTQGAGSPFHFQQGFAPAETTRSIREFLGQKASGDSETSVSVLSPLPRRGHHDDGGRSLLFVRSAVASPVQSARFARLGPRVMKLWLGDAPEAGGLRYLGLDLDTESDVTAQSTLEAVARVMVQAGQSSHWLVVPYHADPIASVGAIAGAPMQIAERRQVGAYRLYRLVLEP